MGQRKDSKEARWETARTLNRPTHSGVAAEQRVVSARRGVHTVFTAGDGKKPLEKNPRFVWGVRFDSGRL